MAMTPILSYGGYALPNVESWRESIPSRIQAITIPRRNGAIIDSRPATDTRIITISGKISESARAYAELEIDALSAILAQGKQALILYSRTTIIRQIYCTKQSFSLDRGAADIGRYIPYELNLVADDPFWTNNTESHDPASPPRSLSTGWTYFTIAAAAVTGNTISYPRIELVTSGAVTDFLIFNSNLLVANWLRITGAYALTAGSFIVIDCAEKTIKVNGSTAMDYMTGDFFGLMGGQDNPLSVYMAGAGGSLSIYWIDRWA